MPFILYLGWSRCSILWRLGLILGVSDTDLGTSDCRLCHHTWQEKLKGPNWGERDHVHELEN